MHATTAWNYLGSLSICSSFAFFFFFYIMCLWYCFNSASYKCVYCVFLCNELCYFVVISQRNIANCLRRPG